MPVARSLLLVLAGVGGGLSGSIAGLASLVSYPALLATGLSPVGANVTNTVALLANSTGSTWGSVPELRGERPALRRLLPTAMAGGALGGALLLLTPSHAFALAVPVLIGGASIAILVPVPARDSVPSLRRDRVVVGAVFAVSIYGGYFGAAAGVLLLALLLAVDGRTMPSASAVKNVVLGVANAVAGVAFALLGPVHWSAALPLAVGLFIGGRVGPTIVRRSPAGVLRVAISLAGLGLAIDLAVSTYR
jgi:uncharacterized membrane protein YfcA